MMRRRIIQFAKSVFPQIREEDLAYAGRILDTKEQNLFNKMTIVDQKHCIDTAKTIQKLSVNKQVNLLVLQRAALLHDIGKGTEITLAARIIYVLIPKRWQSLLFLSKNVTKQLILLQNHSINGVKLAEEAQLDSEIIQLICEHHNPQCIESEILALADRLN